MVSIAEKHQVRKQQQKKQHIMIVYLPIKECFLNQVTVDSNNRELLEKETTV